MILRPGWPLQWLLVGFPVFWAMGLASFATMIMAVPMAVELLRRRPLRLPRGFGFWLLFLLWSFAGVLMLGVNPAGTVPGSARSRILAYAMREAGYVAITVVMLYIGNLSNAEVSQSKIVKWLGALFVTTALGGVVGMIAPNFQFTSPFELILPGSIRYDDYVQHLVHPAVAQVQDVISDATPRPAAPFTYTNVWGFHLTILGVWFFVSWLLKASPGRRVIGVMIMLTGMVTLIYSLNRAAWLGAAVALICVCVRLAVRGRLVLLGSIALAGVLAAGVFYASPLKGVVDARLENGKSNDIRSFTTERAFELSAQSPVIGFGSTRRAYGSASSIAVGQSSDCPQCGNASIGMNGYFYLLLVSTGYVGAALFFGLGAVQVWRARKLHSPTATAAGVVLIMTAFYGFFYDASTWLVVPFVTIGLLWRESELLARRSHPDDPQRPETGYRNA
ncbi:O-antigen ligase [Microlunatus sp. Gsoil 973]|uniref:O-antigen ligase family protein n=1 Tax=Microlunatus sp. Gsoil 973 TaxID=2672569 RepID=UPI0012B49120|nr:O-antigen ligase family protein [Microlunatus sp. Gsoil 973]QGN33901.1 ligase [Microlunatus sp. Gsoil 973]